MSKMKYPHEKEVLQKKLIEQGILYQEDGKDRFGGERKVFKNRTLKQACEWFLETKKKTRKDILSMLDERIQRAGTGAKEKVKLEQLLVHFQGKN